MDFYIIFLHHQVFEVHSKCTAALAGSFDRSACLPYTIADIYFKNEHNISACFLLSRRQETGKRKYTVLYALRVNQRHSVANITFEFNLNFPVLSHHYTIIRLHTFQPSDRTVVLGSTQLLTDTSTRNISWAVKDERCVTLTTLTPSCAGCLEIWKPQLPGALSACPGRYRDGPAVCIRCKVVAQSVYCISVQQWNCSLVNSMSNAVELVH